MHLRPTKAYISFHPSLLCLLPCLLLHTFPHHHHNIYTALLPENTTVSNIQDHYAYAAPLPCIDLLTLFSMKLHGAGKLFTSAPESTLRYYLLPSGVTYIKGIELHHHRIRPKQKPLKPQKLKPLSKK